MKGGFGARLPEMQLRALDFLIGDSSGPGVLHPPGREPIPFVGHIHAEREACERYLRMEFFGLIPVLGAESVHSLITYSEKHECYRMWNFATAQEEPMSMHGKFDGLSLIFVSDPIEMVWGLQRMRCSFTPRTEGVVDYCAELWTIDGYMPYVQATYSTASVHVG